MKSLKISKANYNRYKKVSMMLRNILNNRSSIKTEIAKQKDPKAFHSLLHSVVLNYESLAPITDEIEDINSEELKIILAYEVLAGNIKDKSLKTKLELKLGDKELLEIKRNVFIRINPFKGSIEDFKEYSLTPTAVPNVFKINDDISRKKLSDFHRDKELLEKVKIQNLSSCLPAFILNPPNNSTVIDATAAPGNKTTHLSSIMNNTGKIIAFEREKSRFETLKKQIEEYGAKNIESIHNDFLKIDPSKYNVDYILADPSCSGSGIHLSYNKCEKRVKSLHNFQCMILNHALKFNPKKVVYSVCSIHKEEGEDVIKEILEKNKDYELEKIGDFWEQRGYEEYEFKDKVIRANMDLEEGLNGFFVALLKRKDLQE